MNEQDGKFAAEGMRSDDNGIEQLLREVGRRDEPSADIMNEVRQAVHAEWRAVVAQRRRRRLIGFGVAAGIAAVAVAAFVSMQIVLRPPALVASVARIEGVLQVDASGAGNWRIAAEGERIASGAVIRTDAGTRAALDVAGLSLRMDASSLVRLAAADRVVLDRGALYVDAEPESNGAPLIVDTSFGSVRHVGTQYQVRTVRDAVEVSVREGRVEVIAPQARSEAGAGERLIVQRDGGITRTPVSPQDPVWQWTAQIAPAFDIENQPLTSFLEWVGRETGRHVVYASAQLEEEAAQTVLRGSIRELSPQKTLAAVMATTPFEYTESNAAIEIVGGEQ